MITRLIPIVRLLCKLSLLADDARGVFIKPSIEGAVAGDGVGLVNGAVRGAEGDIVGVISGDCDGERLKISGGGEEAGGMSVEAGGRVEVVGGDGRLGEAGGGVKGEAGGGVKGEAGGGVEVARVSISSFIPPAQCPGVAQVKYLLPGEERGMTVVPPLYDFSGLVIWQES